VLVSMLKGMAVRGTKPFFAPGVPRARTSNAALDENKRRRAENRAASTIVSEMCSEIGLAAAHPGKKQESNEKQQIATAHSRCAERR
jgi:hypothetical protein